MKLWCGRIESLPVPVRWQLSFCLDASRMLPPSFPQRPRKSKTPSSPIFYPKSFSITISPRHSNLDNGEPFDLRCVACSCRSDIPNLYTTGQKITGNCETLFEELLRIISGGRLTRTDAEDRERRGDLCIGVNNKALFCRAANYRQTRARLYTNATITEKCVNSLKRFCRNLLRSFYTAGQHDEFATGAEMMLIVPGNWNEKLAGFPERSSRCVVSCSVSSISSKIKMANYSIIELSTRASLKSASVC